jgi:hypothetical protein
VRPREDALLFEKRRPPYENLPAGEHHLLVDFAASVGRPCRWIHPPRPRS